MHAPIARDLGGLAPGGAAGCSTVAVLAPKCPACVAAYLAPLGIGLEVGGTLAMLLRPGLGALAVVAAGIAVVRWRRRAVF